MLVYLASWLYMTELLILWKTFCTIAEMQKKFKLNIELKSVSKSCSCVTNPTSQIYLNT